MGKGDRPVAFRQRAIFVGDPTITISPAGGRIRASILSPFHLLGWEMIRDSATICALAATYLGLGRGLVSANPTKREKGQELKEQEKEKRLF